MNTSEAACKLAAQRKTHGAGTGRPPQPTPCPKCGKKQPSWREAAAHCRVPRKKSAFATKKSPSL